MHRIKKKIWAYFLQIYPLEQPDKQTDLFVKRQVKTIILSGIGSLLLIAGGLFMAAQTELEGELVFERRDVGEGDYEVELVAEIDGDAYAYPLVVHEREPTPSEFAELCAQATKELKETILGDNRSAEEIVTDLVLPQTALDGLLQVTWEFDRYDLVEADGTHKDTVTSQEGEILHLTAELACGEQQAFTSFALRILPKEKDARSLTEEALGAAVTEADSRSAAEQELALPREVGGEQITWRSTEQSHLLLLLVVCVAGGALLVWHRVDGLKKQCKTREESLTADYAKAVNEMTLLLGAGMSVLSAWQRMCEGYKKRRHEGISYTYEEMLVTERELMTGRSIVTAIEEYGRRCDRRNYRKFAALLTQNITKGGKGVRDALFLEVRQAFEERKAYACRKGEEASTKLLIPMGICLVILMVMVVAPGFWSFVS